MFALIVKKRIFSISAIIFGIIVSLIKYWNEKKLAELLIIIIPSTLFLIDIFYSEYISNAIESVGVFSPENTVTDNEEKQKLSKTKNERENKIKYFDKYEKKI